MTTKERTWSSPPFDLMAWGPDPEPVPECDECADLSRLRGQARRKGDGSLVSDCNVMIRTHATGHAGTPTR
ncbi:hypothetical protein [Streptomyces acidiscabies]|uniref:hypothetical protein n=1 Tax=Streptomyces acidiscabies TaxID=42234 RepID=UPI000951CF8F|nr:hypothetical protein [Streptomyces acidiscabies]